MSELREALAHQREALHALTQSRANAGAWMDEQRRDLDRSCLDPLVADGRRLYDALRKAADEILAAQRMTGE